MIIAYRNLDLEAFDYQMDAGAESFRVRVTNSPAGDQKIGEAESVLVPPGLRPQLRSLEKRRLSLRDLIDLGEDLAALLFPPIVRSMLDRSFAQLGDAEGLRIRLKLDTYALADLPWEYVYIPRPGTPADQKDRRGFLVLDRRISLVRYELLRQPVSTLTPVGSGPYRLVMLLANPQDLNYPQLRLDVEQDNIKQALQGISEIRPEFYPNATVQVLEDALAADADIFHFAGHAKFVGDPSGVHPQNETRG